MRAPLDVLCLVQERHVGHRAALGFGVHDDPMPERQRDGLVVAVTHRAAGINARVAAHHPPAPAGRFRLALQQGAVFLLGVTPFGCCRQT